MARARVRIARRDDRERLLELWLALIEHHRKLRIGYPEAPPLREALVHELERGLAGGDRRLWVAHALEEPIAFLAAQLDGHDAETGRVGRIHELYVAPESRRQGVGRALVKEARRFFDGEGIERISVRVEARNAAALRFWRRQGFLVRARLLEARPSR